jgi:hypothetical protein
MLPPARRWGGKKMTLPIPDDLAGAYKGSGHALAAIHDGVIRDLLYLRDLIPDFGPEDVETAIKNIRLAPTIEHLENLGKVSVGMVSCWEYNEL